MTELEKQHMLALANAALAHLEMDDDAGIWRVGSYGRPFGESFPQSERDILFYAGALSPRYLDDPAAELTEVEFAYAEKLWRNLGEFIRNQCKLDPA